MKERLIAFIKYMNINKAEFERRCGLANGFVDKVGEGTRFSTLERISNTFPELDINWLRTGSGNMLNTRSSTYSTISVKGDNNKNIHSSSNSSLTGNNTNEGFKKVSGLRNDPENENDVLKKEIEYLYKVIAEKDNLIAEKERLIQVLLDTR